jgi:hypothetical protein
MDNAGRVCRGEGVRDLRDDSGNFRDGHRPMCETIRNRLSVVIRHGDERLPGVLADLVNGGNVRMIERAGGARLSQQAGRSFWIAGLVRRQKLEGNASAEINILGEINRTHPAGPDVADDPIVRDLGPNHARLACVERQQRCLQGHVATAHYARAEWRIDR